MSFDVEGSADISRNDAARAREEAIQNAIENAILKATAQLMSISVSDARFQPVKSIIIDEPDKYVNNYKIVTEVKKPDSYQVIVHVVVNLVNLKNDLNKMGFMQVVQAGKISPMVLINVKGLRKYTDFLFLRDFLRSRKKIVKNTPMGKFGDPDDLQGAVLYLLSDLSSFVTGIVVPVDGGFNAYSGV